MSSKLLPSRLAVVRIDVDYSLKRAEKLSGILKSLGVRGTFFIRLHANEYNPFSFESYRIVKQLQRDGHEIGYHSEIVDAGEIWGERVEECLRRDIDVFNRMYGVDIEGIASHGGFTGYNNLDFWRDREPEEFGLRYEAYDARTFGLFNRSLYVSDSEWTQWKCYDKGELQVDNRKSFAEHALDGRDLIYLLIHSDTYFEHHFYE